jgi:hypothetical protein
MDPEWSQVKLPTAEMLVVSRFHNEAANRMLWKAETKA